MKPGQVIRQGDVLVMCIESIPAGAKAAERDPQGRIVLAYGEVTGHAHAILDDWVTELQDEANRRYLDVRGRSVTIVHEEHTAHTLPPGKYAVRIQREYSPEEIRNVAD